MRVIDLRPALEIAFARRWSRADAPGGAPHRSPWISRQWARVVDRWQARRVARRQAPPAGPILVSVGNLALGGTGKTPVIMALARDLATAGARGCVLTRGFRSPLAGPLVVAPDNLLAGDEARLMAGRLAGFRWPVIQARERTLALALAMEQPGKFDYILIEDGHQTAGLGRHLDVVILDRWHRAAAPQGTVLQPVTGGVFPLGPYRESARGADRAGVLLVESEDPLPPVGAGGQAVTGFQRRLALARAGSLDQASLPEGAFAVLSGIARPEAFEQGVKALTGRDPQLALRLRDHQEYGPSLVARVKKYLAQESCAALVTTAKDWVKLAPFWQGTEPVLVAELDVVWGQTNALPQLVEERAGDLGGPGSG
jgi:tetraacyldisaccharide 4'-kinase